MAAGIIIDHVALRKAEQEHAEKIARELKGQKVQVTPAEREHAAQVEKQNKRSVADSASKLPAPVKPGRSRPVPKTPAMNPPLRKSEKSKKPVGKTTFHYGSKTKK